SSRSKQLRPQPRNTLIAKLAASLHTWRLPSVRIVMRMGRIMRTLQEQNPLEECRLTLTFARRPTTPASFYRLGGSLDEIQKGLMSTLLYLL
ncbi:unnamed protein product, partial [Heterotrigona itama]